MATQTLSYTTPTDVSLKRGRDVILEGSAWPANGYSEGADSWVDFDLISGLQTQKKLKGDGPVPANFGLSMGWTAGPPMMDLLSMRRPLPDTRRAQATPWQQESGRLPSDAPAERLEWRGHRRHQSVPVIPTYTAPIQRPVPLRRAITAEQDDYNLHLEDNDYFYDELELVDERLSIGEIVWQAPNRAHIALPARFDVAEGLANFPPPTPSVSSAHTISKYVTHDESSVQYACLSVRDSADWHTIKEDPIFRDLSGILQTKASRKRSATETSRAWPMMDVIAEDAEAEEREAIKRAQDALIGALASERLSTQNRDSGVGFDLRELEDPPMTREASDHPQAAGPQKRSVGHRRTQSFNPQAQTFVKDKSHSSSLVLQPAFDFRPSGQLKSALKPAHGRARSQSPQRTVTFSPQIPSTGDQFGSCSRPSGHSTRPRSLSPQRQPPPVVPEPKAFRVDQSQEDILSRLGVTGTAQKAYATPGPALNPLARQPVMRAGPEQQSFRFPAPTTPQLQPSPKLRAAGNNPRPLREISSNAGAMPPGKKRGRGQSEDFDNSMKRPREAFIPGDAGAEDTASGRRW